MRVAVFLFAVAVPCFSYAVDFSDCEDRLHRLSRAGRNAGMSVESPEDLDAARSAINDVEHALRKAKTACEVGSQSLINSYCLKLHEIAALKGISEARKMCNQQIEQVYPGLCVACLGP